MADLQEAGVARGDLAAGGFGIILGAVILVESLRIADDSSTFSIVGPKAAPVTIGVVMMALSVVLMGQCFWRARRRVPDTADAAVGPDIDTGPEVKPEPRRIAVVLGMLLAYILLFVPLGYLIATTAFLAALTTFIRPQNWLRNIAFAAGFAGVVYVIFSYGLEVRLPVGLLG
ncbi:hypothetical protein MMUR_02010 [Mycolicibacterium murale]|uniref:DUF1468 domain-containing protein n=1 Tax=Mycolicibacterium murale TaxID=182220 RepID=A0A7I9WE88_9MYCO|nr:tripartite tricarboxylate transporter TctB family protein [Mycolicibacterium murale]MCV7182239.1 tripartite tricarboxylate transporter TctB family protein [Mycolicibacterium murale]GFG56065.1 hypothetical protein MMUR_02010 [Mycolicibacterium murale]